MDKVIAQLKSAFELPVGEETCEIFEDTIEENDEIFLANDVGEQYAALSSSGWFIIRGLGDYGDFFEAEDVVTPLKKFMAEQLDEYRSIRQEDEHSRDLSYVEIFDFGPKKWDNIRKVEFSVRGKVRSDRSETKVYLQDQKRFITLRWRDTPPSLLKWMSEEEDENFSHTLAYYNTAERVWEYFPDFVPGRRWKDQVESYYKSQGRPSWPYYKTRTIQRTMEKQMSTIHRKFVVVSQLDGRIFSVRNPINVVYADKQKTGMRIVLKFAFTEARFETRLDMNLSKTHVFGHEIHFPECKGSSYHGENVSMTLQGSASNLSNLKTQRQGFIDFFKRLEDVFGYHKQYQKWIKTIDVAYECSEDGIKSRLNDNPNHLR